MNGKTIGENVARGARAYNRDVIRRFDEPIFAEGGTVVLRGNLCPDGAVLKQTAASPQLCEHTGPAYVFESYQQMHDTIDSMDLPIDKDTVLVMKGCGPKGAPGFPEWGHIPMPKVLLEQGVSDCVRISRRAHERDQLRDGGAARVAGIAHRRAAGGRADGGP